MPGRDNLARVSVIIPTYNRSSLLRLTVESVLAQTYPNIEIIVVDDGSTDDTTMMMAQYAGRVTYIRQANQGTEAARVAGLQVATGEYINFLDHDDLFMPTKIERQVQVLDSRPEIGLVHCRYYYIDNEGNVVDKVGLLPEGDVLKKLVCGCFLWSGGPLFRRQCLDQIGLSAEATWYDDWGTWLQIALAGYPFVCIQEPLGAFRVMPGTRSDTEVVNQARDTLEVLDRVFADPRLPADVLAVKDQAYGTMRFWISCRFYATGHWDDAQRNLAEVLTLRPQLLEHPDSFVQLLSNHAVDRRISDPIQFVADVFNHFPECAGGLRRYRSNVLGWVYTRLSLRSYRAGKIAQAKHQLAEAIALAPSILERDEDFTNLLHGYAVSLPAGSPTLYVETVLQNLPASAQRLERLRSRILSEVSVACAFEDYCAGRQRLAVRQILTALRYRPSWLKNRGIVSILLRSLLGWLSRQPIAG